MGILDDPPTLGHVNASGPFRPGVDTNPGDNPKAPPTCPPWEHLGMQIEPCALFFSAISSKAGTAGEGLLRRGRFDSPVFLSAYLLTFSTSLLHESGEIGELLHSI